MKLRFEENEYYLMKDGEERLSRKNCEAIANGYDLDELAHNHAEGNDNYLTAENSFKVGVETILEILGDKKFSEEDLANILVRFLNDIKNMKYRGDEVSIINQLLQSLQQTEWDVTFNPDEKDSEGCLILKKL